MVAGVAFSAVRRSPIGSEARAEGELECARRLIRLGTGWFSEGWRKLVVHSFDGGFGKWIEGHQARCRPAGKSIHHVSSRRDHSTIVEYVNDIAFSEQMHCANRYLILQ